MLDQYLLICSVAFAGAVLTLFSGFGLGTVLVPVFALFFPIEVAIALTAIVHFLNNLFKLVLFGKNADKNVVIRFGIPSLIASFIGALLLAFISKAPAIYSYELNGHLFEITPVKLIIAVLLIVFVLFDIVPGLVKIGFDKKYLVAGGFLSGFFGGLSGNQGALRSAFILKVGLSKETFIATGVIIACMVDVARLAVYSKNFFVVGDLNYALLTMATAAAFLGTLLATSLLKKVTIKTFQYFVAVMLLVFAILLGTGIL